MEASRQGIIRTILAILLLLPLSVSAGELDGTGVVCELLNSKPELDAFQAGYWSHMAFTFEDCNVASKVVTVLNYYIDDSHNTFLRLNSDSSSDSTPKCIWAVTIATTCLSGEIEMSVITLMN